MIISNAHPDDSIYIHSEICWVWGQKGSLYHLAWPPGYHRPLHFPNYLYTEPCNMCLTKAKLFLTKAYLLERHLVLIWSNQEERIHYFVGILFYWLITPTIKNVGHVSNLNLSGSRFHPLDLIILFRVKLKSPLVPIIFSLCVYFSEIKLPLKYFVLFFLIRLHWTVKAHRVKCFLRSFLSVNF